MSDSAIMLGSWALRSIGVGLVLVGLVHLILWRLPEPRQRLRFLRRALGLGLVVPVLCALPSWWQLPPPPWPNQAPTVADPAKRSQRSVLVAQASPPREPDWQQPIERSNATSPAQSDSTPLQAESIPPQAIQPMIGPPLPEVPWVQVEEPLQLNPRPRPTIGAQSDTPQANPNLDGQAEGDWTPAAAPGPAVETSVSTTLTPEASPEASPWSDRLPTREDALLLVGIAFVAYGVWGIGQLGLGLWQLQRYVRESVPASPRLQAAASLALPGYHPLPRVLIHPTLSSPICFGIWRPTIILPASLSKQLSPQELSWVFAHEGEHLKNRDPQTSLFAGLCRAWMGWMPGFAGWQRALQLAQEQLADAAALAQGGSPSDYAVFLMRLTQGTTSPTTSRALPAHGVRAGRSQLFWRVRMMIEQNPAGPSPADVRRSRRWRSWGTFVLLSTTVGLSGLGWVQATDDPPPLEPATRERESREPREAKSPRETQERREGQPKGLPDSPPESRPERPEAPRPPQPPRPTERRVEGVRVESLNLAELKAQSEKLAAIHQDLAAVIQAKNTLKALELLKRLEDLQKQLEAAPRVFRFESTGPAGQSGPGHMPPAANPLPPTTPTPPGWQPLPAPTPGQPPMVFRLPMDGRPQAIQRLRDLMDATENPITKKALSQAIEELERSLVPNLYAPVPNPTVPTAPTPPGASAGSPLGFGLAGRDGLSSVYPFGGFAPIPEALRAQLNLKPGQGVVVAKRLPKEYADRTSLKEHDVVLTINNKPVNNPAEAYAILNTASRQGSVELKIIRGGQEMTIKLDRIKDSYGALQPQEFEPRKEPKFTFEQMQSQVNNQNFKLSGRQGSLEFQLKGQLRERGEVVVEEFIVRRDGKTVPPSEYTPEFYRAARSLLNSIR